MSFEFFFFFYEDLESDAYVWLIDWLIDFGCVGSSFLCEGSLQLWQAGATLHRDARASLVAEHRLQTRRLSSYGSRAQPLRGMWDPPRPGLEPASPALAGRLSTTAPPGKPLFWILIIKVFSIFSYLIDPSLHHLLPSIQTFEMLPFLHNQNSFFQKFSEAIQYFS